jgi:hypothetical protein
MHARLITLCPFASLAGLSGAVAARGRINSANGVPARAQ